MTQCEVTKSIHELEFYMYCFKNLIFQKFTIIYICNPIYTSMVQNSKNVQEKSQKDLSNQQSRSVCMSEFITCTVQDKELITRQSSIILK